MLAFAYSKRMGERHALQERLFVENTAVHQTHYVRQGVAGRSPATGFILLFVVGLKVNCCMLMQDINARNDARL